jgi:hypothetical protein
MRIASLTLADELEIKDIENQSQRFGRKSRLLAAL